LNLRRIGYHELYRPIIYLQPGRKLAVKDADMIETAE
jgi:hypothetical protein